MKLELSRLESFSVIPKAPGVYLFRDAARAELYVGKAKDLRQRLVSYLRPGVDVAAKTALMLSQATGLELIITATEKEALILEASLIREHRPRYNVLFRDDKAYPFLRLDPSQAFPRLTMVRCRKRDGAVYFGPYPSARAVRETLRFLAPIFGLRSCSDATLRTRSRPCLQFQIGRCTAPCADLITSDAYRERIDQVRLFLEGRTGSLLKKLTQRMEEAAEDLRFEEAAVLRDRVRAIERVLERQVVVAGQEVNWDVAGLSREGERASVAVLRVRDGVVQGQEVHHLRRAGGVPDGEVLSLFLRRFFSEGEPLPRELLVPAIPEDVKVLSDWLGELAGHRVTISRPQRGLRRRLLSMAGENARQALVGARSARESWRELSSLLAERLELKGPPITVEGVDISTTGGELAVGSLVAFRDGWREKKAYRHYRIRRVSGIDDYAMIREVVDRRLASGKENGDLPNLMLIDGGRGQLGQAADALTAAGLSGKVNLVALAKEGADEGEKIYVLGRSEALWLPRHDPALCFLQRVRDEAHRFGVTLHRKKRDRRSLRSSLEEIPGVGPKRQNALLSRFGSLSRLRQATQEEVGAVPGISAHLAAVILEHLHRV